MGAACYLFFLPVSVFVVSDRYDGPGVLWAAVAALIALLPLVPAVFRRRIDAAPVAALAVIFAAVAGTSRLTTSYGTGGRAVVCWAAALVVLGSLLWRPVSRTPIRAVVSPSQWETPACGRLVRTVALHWAAGLTLIGGSFAVASSVEDAALRTVSAWILPLTVAAGVAAADEHRWRRFGDQLVADDVMAEAAMDTLVVGTTTASFPWTVPADDARPVALSLVEGGLGRDELAPPTGGPVDPSR